jgi:hypothetical protein
MRTRITLSCSSRLKLRQPVAQALGVGAVDPARQLLEHGLRDDDFTDGVEQVVDLLDAHSNRTCVAVGGRLRLGAGVRCRLTLRCRSRRHSVDRCRGLLRMWLVRRGRVGGWERLDHVFAVALDPLEDEVDGVAGQVRREHELPGEMTDLGVEP